ALPGHGLDAVSVASREVHSVARLHQSERSAGSRRPVGARPPRPRLSRDTARAMSQENVELVRSVFAATERGDFSDAGWAHSEIEYVIVDGPEPTAYKGLAGLALAMRDMLSPWERYRGNVEEYRDLDA